MCFLLSEKKEIFFLKTFKFYNKIWLYKKNRMDNFFLKKYNFIVHNK